MRTPARPVDPEKMTIPNCLEAILNYATDNPFTVVNEENGEEYTYVPEGEYDYLTEKLCITREQAEMLAAVLEISISSNADVSNLAEKFGISNLAFLSREEQLEALVEKRYIRAFTSASGGETSYYVPLEVIKSFRKNEVPTYEDYEGLSTVSMVRKWNKLFTAFWRHDEKTTSLFRNLLDIIRYNKKSEFKKAWDAHGMEELTEENQVFFLYMITRNFCYSNNSFEWSNYERLFEDSIDEYIIRDEILDGSHDLFKMGLMEHEMSGGMADTNTVCLTEACIKEFIGLDLRKNDVETNGMNLIKNNKIGSKQMFYNEGEGKQIERLCSLLQQENFKNVVARLQQKGMRTGFCSLLFGGPGTGKTESVYQIARQTGRDVFLVDVADLKNKYVGESEKNVRALFKEYKDIVRSRELAPILLFNEADAVLGVRAEGVTKAVDRMENSLQNIILEEMESLEGIMIATTNLTKNFDPAFERRFIFKVNLSKPSAEARSHIWESLVDGIRPEDAMVLAEEYEFSGGQIENISRQMTVDFILSGKEPELADIREMCSHETIDPAVKSSRSRIGFQIQ